MITRKIAIKKVQTGVWVIVFKKFGKPVRIENGEWRSYQEVRRYVNRWARDESPAWKDTFEDLGYIRGIPR